MPVRIHPKHEILLSLWKWRINRDGYVARRTSYKHPETKKPIGTQKFFYRQILNYDGPLTVDHLDGDPLNNHPDNLEIVPRGVNIARQNAGGPDRIPMCEMDTDCKNQAVTIVTAFDETLLSCEECKHEWDN